MENIWVGGVEWTSEITLIIHKHYLKSQRLHQSELAANKFYDILIAHDVNIMHSDYEQVETCLHVELSTINSSFSMTRKVRQAKMRNHKNTERFLLEWRFKTLVEWNFLCVEAEKHLNRFSIFLPHLPEVTMSNLSERPETRSVCKQLCELPKCFQTRRQSKILNKLRNSFLF